MSPPCDDAKGVGYQNGKEGIMLSNSKFKGKMEQQMLSIVGLKQELFIYMVGVIHGKIVQHQI